MPPSASFGHSTLETQSASRADATAPDAHSDDIDDDDDGDIRRPGTATAEIMEGLLLAAPEAAAAATAAAVRQ